MSRKKMSAPRFAELVRETLERALAIALAREREPPGPNPFDPPPGEAAGYRDWRVFVRQWEGSGLAVEEHVRALEVRRCAAAALSPRPLSRRLFSARTRWGAYRTPPPRAARRGRLGCRCT